MYIQGRYFSYIFNTLIGTKCVFCLLLTYKRRKKYFRRQADMTVEISAKYLDHLTPPSYDLL